MSRLLNRFVFRGRARFIAIFPNICWKFNWYVLNMEDQLTETFKSLSFHEKWVGKSLCCLYTWKLSVYVEREKYQTTKLSKLNVKDFYMNMTLWIKYICKINTCPVTMQWCLCAIYVYHLFTRLSIEIVYTKILIFTTIQTITVKDIMELYSGKVNPLTPTLKMLYIYIYILYFHFPVMYIIL